MLKRKTPLKRTRKPARRIATMDTEYILRVKQLPCAASVIPGHICSGAIEAHHAGERPGVSMKAADSTCVPLCSLAHAQWHGATGWCKGWDRASRRWWADVAIAQTQAALEVDAAMAEVLL